MPGKLCPHSLKPVDEMRQFVEAGCPLIKLVNDFGAAQEFRGRFPDLTIIGRVTEGAEHDPVANYHSGMTYQQAAQAFVDRQKEKYRLNPAIKIWEGPNEPAFGSGEDPENLKAIHWYGNYEAHRLKLLAGMGLRGVVGNFATGNPDLPESDRMAMWREFLPAIRAAKQHNGMLGVHEYTSPWMWYFTGKYQLANCPDFEGEVDEGDTGWLTFRYRKFYRGLFEPEGLGDVPLVITEFGLDRAGVGCPGSDMPAGAWKDVVDWWKSSWDGRSDPIDYWKGGGRDAERYYAEQLIWADRELRKDPYVLGATIFSFGHTGIWERFDIAGTGVPGHLLAYMASVRDEVDPVSGRAAPERGTPPAVPVAPCKDNSRYVADVTIPDHSKVAAGAGFTKTWRVRNTGTCEWNQNYTLRPIRGERMGSPNAESLTANVPAGAEANISVDLTAPDTPGPATGYWRLYNANGQAFGTNLTVVIETTPAERPAPEPPAAAPPCKDNAGFVADVTIPDGTPIEPGEKFTKTWRVTNSGTCEWGDGYQLVFDGGAQMDGPDRSPLARTVAPGEQLDISVELTAPQESGDHTGKWRLQNARGETFGFRGHPLTVVINVPGVRPSVRTLVGLHGRADGPLRQGDLNAIRESKMEAVKLTSAAIPEDLAAVRAIRGDMFIVVRLFLAFMDQGQQRSISADQFAHDTRGDLKKFYDRGLRYFEIHNEPNLFLEGYGKNWTGVTFGDWWLRVRNILRSEFPEAKFGWPGVSPGPVIPNVRGEAEKGFVLAARKALEACDWIGVHCYWQNRAEMLSDEVGNFWKWYLQQFPGKPVMITEFSNPNAGVPKDEKGRQYVDWLAQLDGPTAVFSYVSSASHGFEHETWVDENQQLTSIPGIVGRR